MTCEKHKRYQAKAKPTGSCDKCWGMWLWAEVKRALRTGAPNTMTEECLHKAIRNHRHAVEKAQTSTR